MTSTPKDRLLRSVTRAREESFSVWLQLRADDPDRLMGVVTDWVASAQAQVPDGELGQIRGPVRTAADAVLVNLAELEPAQVRSLTLDLTATVAAEDIGGTIRVAPRSFPDFEMPVGWTAVSVAPRWRPDARQRFQERRRTVPRNTPLSGKFLRSDVDGHAWTALVDAALAWVTDLPGATSWHVEDDMASMALDRSAALDVARLALRSEATPLSLTVAAGEERVRTVTFEYSPRVLFGFADRERESGSRLREIRAVLTRIALYVNSGFAFTSTVMPQYTRSLLEGYYDTGAVPAYSFGSIGLRNDQLLFDAFGAIYLGPGFDGRVEHPEHYGVEPMGPGRFLAHERSDAWFHRDWTRNSDAAIMAAARADLAEILATEDDVTRERARLRG